MKINSKDSIFSFLLCKDKALLDKYVDAFDVKNTIGDYTLLTDKKTPLQYSKCDDREFVIFGYAVDVFTGQSDNLAQTVLQSTTNLNEVIDYEKRFGGKYVIFYAEKGKCYCLGDATCSVPIFYTTGLTDIICCSNPHLIIEELNLKKDPVLQKIRESGDLNQAMPFDVTPYKEIKQLIPNHYLDLTEQKVNRFVISYKKQKELSPEEAAEITAPMIENITKLYLSKFDIYCPLTSGRDSRVVYAFLNSLSEKKVNSYTIWHDRFENDNQDWTVPLELVKLCSGNHQQLYQETITKEIKASMDEILGKDGYPQDAFTLSVTVKEHFSDCATIEGDIIGQVGKCSLHRDIPLCFATPRYFRCKLHNYSNESRVLLKKWLKEIKYSGENVNPFDLFSVENRLGVWASHTHLIRNIMGMPFVNIFNSRSIIYTWTAVNRAERMKSMIHIELIKLIKPELLNIPFEQEKSGLKNAARSNKFVFYFASFAKYYIERRKFYNN